MVFGKKQLEQLAAFTTSAICYSLAAAITMVYITDWKPIVSYIPFYNGQFKNEKKKTDDSGCN